MNTDSIYTQAADAITDDDLTTYDQIKAEHAALDWAGHDNRAERARHRLAHAPTEPIPFTMELMPAPVPISKPDTAEPAPIKPWSQCRGCLRPIWWGRNDQGGPHPYDVANNHMTKRSHFETCPKADSFRKKAS